MKMETYHSHKTFSLNKNLKKPWICNQFKEDLLIEQRQTASMTMFTFLIIIQLLPTTIEWTKCTKRSVHFKAIRELRSYRQTARPFVCQLLREEGADLQP